MKKLDQLLNAFSRHGKKIVNEMKPALGNSQIDELTAWFPKKVSKDIYNLYTWRNGQSLETEMPFTFRDMQFVDLQSARTNYESIVSVYGNDDDWEVDVKHCFPFAECEGAFLCLDCDTKKIVSINDGVDVFFESFDSMLNTCIEWVSQKGFDFFDDIPNEKDIWSKHNPGITLLEEEDESYEEEDPLGPGSYPRTLEGNLLKVTPISCPKDHLILTIDEYLYVHFLCPVGFEFSEDGAPTKPKEDSPPRLSLTVEKYIEEEGEWEERYLVISGKVVGWN